MRAAAGRPLLQCASHAAAYSVSPPCHSGACVAGSAAGMPGAARWLLVEQRVARSVHVLEGRDGAVSTSCTTLPIALRTARLNQRATRCRPLLPGMRRLLAQTGPKCPAPCEPRLALHRWVLRCDALRCAVWHTLRGCCSCDCPDAVPLALHIVAALRLAAVLNAAGHGSAALRRQRLRPVVRQPEERCRQRESKRPVPAVPFLGSGQGQEATSQWQGGYSSWRLRSHLLHQAWSLPCCSAEPAARSAGTISSALLASARRSPHRDLLWPPPVQKQKVSEAPKFGSLERHLGWLCCPTG